MTRPHCSDPSRCSQCLGAQPRVVTIVAGVRLVDGTPIDKHRSPYHKSSLRGGEANRRNHAPKPAKRRR